LAQLSGREREEFLAYGRYQEDIFGLSLGKVCHF
jgi:hypothetical protein